MHNEVSTTGASSSSFKEEKNDFSNYLHTVFIRICSQLILFFHCLAAGLSEEQELIRRCLKKIKKASYCCVKAASG